MTLPRGLVLPMAQIAELCGRYHVRELAVFGSAARGELDPDSDIDLLVEFAPDADIGFLAFNRLAAELTALVGRKVDLVPKAGLKEAIRSEVLGQAKLVYAP